MRTCTANAYISRRSEAEYWQRHVIHYRTGWVAHLAQVDNVTPRLPDTDVSYTVRLGLRNVVGAWSKPRYFFSGPKPSKLLDFSLEQLLIVVFDSLVRVFP